MSQIVGGFVVLSLVGCGLASVVAVAAAGSTVGLIKKALSRLGGKNEQVP